MIKHVSIFFLKDENKEENKKSLVKMLEQFEDKLENIAEYQVGSDCMKRPPKGLPGVPEFGDVMQIIGFKNEADAGSYAMLPEHMELMKSSESMIERVVAIDIQ